MEGCQLPEDYEQQKCEQWNITETNRPVLLHLQKLMFFCEDFDKLIVQFLKNGSVDLNDHLSLLDEKNYDLKKRQARDTASEISLKCWSGGFSYTEEAFVTEVDSLLTVHWQSLEVYHADLDHLDKSLQFFSEQQRELYLNKAKGYKRVLKPSKPIENIMIEMLPASNGCNPQHIYHLLGYKKKDFFDWMQESQLAMKHLKLFYKWFPDDLDPNAYSSVEIGTIREVKSSLQEAVEKMRKVSAFNAQRLSDIDKG